MQPPSTRRPATLSVVPDRRRPFVGRAAELARLSEVLDLARRGTQVAAVVGEAGIGKTRLAGELCELARARGHRVVWGHGWDDAAAPPHWPWTQVVRQLTGTLSGTDLGSLVLPEDRPLDRAELFDATTALLDAAARRDPLVVVLDDLHLADPSTLALCGFVTTHLRTAPLLLLATVRPADGPAVPDRLAAPAAEALGRGVTTVALGGLDVAAIAELAGTRFDATELHEVTAGNPLFVEQALDADLGGAASVLDALVVRMGRLGDAAQRTVTAAAVLGRQPTVEDLAALLEQSPVAVAGHLAEAARAGLVDRATGRLSHPLVAEAALTVARPELVAELHGAAADRCTGVSSAAERAWHLLRAGGSRRPDAVEACRAAAIAASTAHAHEEAAAHLHRARAHLGDDPCPLLAGEVELELAAAEVQASGREAAEPHYVAAWELARRSGDLDLIARAAARHGIQYHFAGGVGRDTAANARTALGALDAAGEATTGLHARLHANLAAALVADEPDAARAHARRAVQIARTGDDPATLAAALVAEQVADLGPATLPHRLETAREVVALAEQAGAHDLAVHGSFLLMGALLERGDIGELDAQLSRQRSLIDRFAAPRFARHALWFQCTRAMLDGRADDVEAIAGECYAIAERLGDPDGIAVFGAQYGVALWMRGRVIEMEQAYVESMRTDPAEPVWQAVLAWLWSSHGRLDQARGALSRLPPVDELPSGQYTLLTLVTAADAALAVDDEDRIAELWETMLPFADRVVPIAMGAACWGTVALRLGALALRLGRADEGIAHLERAISLCARLGARPWLADAQLALAEALLDAGRGEDPRVPALVAEAAVTVRTCSLAVFADRLDTLAARAEVGPGPAPTGPAVTVGPRHGAPAGERPRIAVLGTFEVTATDGSTPRWTSRKARRLLKVLVARRGAPVPREVLMDLLWPGEDPATLTNRLSVALSTVRRSLDPGRSLPAGHVVATESGAVRLVLRHVDVDAEQFLAAASSALDAHRSGAPEARALLRAARALHGGEPLPDEPYATWAGPLRTETALAHATLLHCEAGAALAGGDHLGASEAFRSLLEHDRFDEPAHQGLIASLRDLGAHGQADAAQRRYEAAMAELGIPLSG
jgi:DNA-binding SARP family transcriptional activator/tetratricopeptide (TPR) repeat protein